VSPRWYTYSGVNTKAADVEVPYEDNRHSSTLD
jgi:hypothetical protein